MKAYCGSIFANLQQSIFILYVELLSFPFSDYDESELFRWTKWFFYEVNEKDKMDQLATKAFNKDHDNIYRG